MNTFRQIHPSTTDSNPDQDDCLIQACRDSHEGDLCGECTVESCRFHPVEVAEPEPVAAAGGA